MPGIWITQRPFSELLHDLAFIVSRIKLPWFAGARWLQRKDASISTVTLYDWVTLAQDRESFVGVAVIELGFTRGDTLRNFYNIPLLVTKARRSAQDEPLVVVSGCDYSGYVYDATGTGDFAAALLGAVTTGAVLNSKRGHFRFDCIGSNSPDASVHTVVTDDRDTTNTVMIVDSSKVVKVYRRLQAGISPDIEMSKGLDGVGFSSIPRPLGYGVYSGLQGVTCPAFFVQEFVENQGDAWSILCGDALQFMKRRLEDSSSEESGEGGIHDFRRNFGLCEGRLGAVTAGLHRASSGVKDDEFTPEAMRPEDVANLISNIVSTIPITIEELKQANLDLNILEEAMSMYESSTQREGILKYLRQAEDVLTSSEELGMKIRIHGDLHLGQFLQVRGNGAYDFVIIDFEGEPLRPVCERLRKSSPLRDVAGMLRSFDYSGCSAAFRMDDFPDQRERLMAIAGEWGRQTGERFLNGYLEKMRRSCAFLLPRDPRNFQLLLLCFKLEKALYEVRYELRNRPRWVNIALRGTVDSINDIRKSFDCGG